MHTENRRRVKMLVFGAGLLLVALYGYYEFRGFLYGPELALPSPQSGEVITTPTVEVSGTTERIVKITLNGASIFVDESGAFSETVAVMEGYNRFEVSVGTVSVIDRQKFERLSPHHPLALRFPFPIDESATSSASVEN